ncbi:diacylglycerol kinase domain protein [Bordetella holmesii 35009]|nr:diacylglycerol kinase domain protein [Bordetella holmesii 35009]
MQPTDSALFPGSGPHPPPYKSSGGLRRILNVPRYCWQDLKAAVK